MSRDRYESNADRFLHVEELDRYSIAVVRNPRPLLLIDLRYEGANLLGVSTDAVRAKAQAAGRRLSQEVYDRAVESSPEEAPALNLSRLSGLADILDKLFITVLAQA